MAIIQQSKPIWLAAQASNELLAAIRVDACNATTPI